VGNIASIANIFPKLIGRMTLAAASEHELKTMPDGQPLEGIAVVRSDELGFLKIDASRFHATLDPNEFSGRNYKTLRERMDQYFKAKIDVFEEKEGETASAEPSELPASEAEPQAKPPAAVSATFDLALIFWGAEDRRARLKSRHRVLIFLLLGLIPGFLLAASWATSQPVPTDLATLAIALFGASVLVAMVSVLIFLITFFAVLPNGYRDSRIWPDFLEMRLMKDIRSKFAGVDEEIRSLTDIFAKIFLHNLRKFVEWKRYFQRFYSWCAIGSAVAVWGIYTAWTWDTLKEGAKSNSVDYGSLATVASIAYAIMAAGVYASLYWFNRNNTETSNNNYNANLTVTCSKVAHEISTRMSSLGAMVIEFKKRQGDLLLKGEEIDENIQNDAELSGHRGFFLTQVILWISKRSEYLQLYLVDRMQEMQREFFVLDTEGYDQAFAHCRSLARTATLIAVVLAVLSAVATFNLFPLVLPKGETASLGAHLTHLLQQPPLWISFAFLFVLWLCELWVIFYIAKRSYSNPAWNPQFEKLKAALDTDGWMTFNKLRVDEALAAQYQRALGAIYTAEERLSKKH
jgi:hypothetical protein